MERTISESILSITEATLPKDRLSQPYSHLLLTLPHCECRLLYAHCQGAAHYISSVVVNNRGDKHCCHKEWDRGRCPAPLPWNLNFTLYVLVVAQKMMSGKGLAPMERVAPLENFLMTLIVSIREATTLYFLYKKGVYRKPRLRLPQN